MNEQLDIEKERAEFEKLSAGLTWLGKLPCGTYSDPTTAEASCCEYFGQDDYSPEDAADDEYDAMCG
jgi:hypothetical protein